jgi:hypothetical protein
MVAPWCSWRRGVRLHRSFPARIHLPVLHCRAPLGLGDTRPLDSCSASASRDSTAVRFTARLPSNVYQTNARMSELGTSAIFGTERGQHQTFLQGASSRLFSCDLNSLVGSKRENREPSNRTSLANHGHSFPPGEEHIARVRNMATPTIGLSPLPVGSLTRLSPITLCPAPRIDEAQESLDDSGETSEMIDISFPPRATDQCVYRCEIAN